MPFSQLDKSGGYNSDLQCALGVDQLSALILSIFMVIGHFQTRFADKII